MVSLIVQKVVMERSQIQSSTTIDTDEETEETYMLILPYKGEQGDRPPRNINREINHQLPENKEVQIIYAGTKLGSKTNIKDVIDKEHQHDLIYSVKCPL